MLCIATICSQGQANITISESLTGLSDSVMKSEIASFTIIGASLNKTGTLAKSALIEIPLLYCSDKEVHLSLSTFTSSVSTFIHLYFKGQAAERKLDSVFLVTHSHFLVEFPATAFEELYQSNSCNFNGGGKKSTFFSEYYKAFYSKDKKRLYIYMLGETGAAKYEVTWIIVNNKYYNRVLDHIP